MVRRRLLVILHALLLCSQPAGSHELRFGPVQGARVSKHFAITVQAKLDAMEQEMDGRPFDAGPMEVELSSATTIRITDHYRSFDNGRPSAVQREFELLEGQLSYKLAGVMEGRESTIPKASAFQGRKVVFTWDAGAGAYAATYEDAADADPKMLARLREDTDLRGFLPNAAVAEGDSWKVDAKRLEEVLSPGGDLKLLPQERGGADEPLLRERWDDLEGDVLATFRGVRTDAGSSLAVVELKGAVTTTDSRQQDAVTEAHECVLELTGELLWDLTARRPHALSLEGPMRQSMTRSGTEKDDDGMSYPFVERSRFSGTMRCAPPG